MPVKNIEKQELLDHLSKEIFWNCNRSILKYDEDKNIIIPRIIEYGRPNDELIMFKIYTSREIKKIAVKIEGLNKEKIFHFSKLLKISQKRFTSYNKKQWHELVNNNDI